VPRPQPSRPSQDAVDEGENRSRDRRHDDEAGVLRQGEGRHEDRVDRDLRQHLGGDHEERDRHQGRDEARLARSQIEHPVQHAGRSS
jgi:hypothetical protein